MQVLLSGGRSAALCALSAGLLAAVLAFAPSGVAKAAEIYISGDMRASYGSAEFDGYKSAVGVVSGEDGDWTWVFAAALGIAQPLDSWKLRGRSLDGWALRGEIEIDPWRKYEVSTSGPDPGSELAARINTRTLLANFWLDFPVHRKLSGYAGFGIGVVGADISAVDRGGSSESDDDRKRTEREFGFQVGAGLEYPVLDYLRVSLGYRYLDLSGFEQDLTYNSGASTGRIEVDMASHELLVGLRLSFDILNSPFD
jgi:opacity protein-like surface antigen